MRYRFIKFILVSLIILMPLMEIEGLAHSSDVIMAKSVRPIVRYASRIDTSLPLSEMPVSPPTQAVRGGIFEQPINRLPNREVNSSTSSQSNVDPVLQGLISGPRAPSIGVNFEGVNNVNFVLPPDPVGDIGPNHYVQMVNLSFAIWNRNGSILHGPVNNNSLWQNFGGPCETTNNGDPIVLYDHLADRWLMSQFAIPDRENGPYYQCIAISQTPDPTGSWYRYEFLISNNKLNDYPKFGVWPDGYYLTFNQFVWNSSGGGSWAWAGQGVAVFERDQMLNGDTSRMVYFDLYDTEPGLGGMLPADLDGPVPPEGAPNPFAQVDDDAWGYLQDQLQVGNFHVDWNTPTNSTFTFDSTLPTAVFDSNMCGYSRNCIPQPGGTPVDAISDLLMYRLQYRNFGPHQTMVVNHTVDVDGSDHAGIRWYELRDSGTGWTIHQQGTYAPDSDHRWMGSRVMNGYGDIALGYSVSSLTTYPSIRFTGRLADDPLTLMTTGEGEIIAGTGFQSHPTGRWGDYSMMAVDPLDDCTFWYTQEYYQPDILGFRWRTRIGSFNLDDCDESPSVSITNPSDGSTVSGTVSVSADASDDFGVNQVEFFADSESIGVDTETPYEVSWDTTSVLNGEHTLTATVTDTIGQNASDSIGVTVNNPTGVSISSFNAVLEEEILRISWETVQEVDLIGFRVYRSDSVNGDQLSLNTVLIPAKVPGSLLGASYDMLDDSVQPGLTYYVWLEPVKLEGPAKLLGPAQAAMMYRIWMPLLDG